MCVYILSGLLEYICVNSNKYIPIFNVVYAYSYHPQID